MCMWTMEHSCSWKEEMERKCKNIRIAITATTTTKDDGQLSFKKNNKINRYWAICESQRRRVSYCIIRNCNIFRPPFQTTSSRVVQVVGQYHSLNKNVFEVEFQQQRFPTIH